MNLKEMREMVANLLDYNPNVKAYNEEINRLINEEYINFFMTQPWEFAQRTVDIYTKPDATDTAAQINKNATAGKWTNVITVAPNITQVSGDGNLNHEGSMVVVSDASDADDNGLYIIDSIDFGNNKFYVSKVSSNRNRVNWQSGQGLGGGDVITATAKEFYLNMPRDCAQILGVGIRNLNEAGSGQGNALGNIYTLTRKRDEELDLRIDLEGTPVYFVAYDRTPPGFTSLNANLTPRANKDFFVDTTTGTAWPAGTYEFAMAYYYRGVLGPISDTVSKTLNGTNQVPRFLTNDTSNLGQYGLKKVFFVKLKSITGKDGATTFEETFFRDLSGIYHDSVPIAGYPFFSVDENNTSDAWVQSVFAITGLEDLTTLPRHRLDGTRQMRIRLWPHPTSSTPIRVRYIHFPLKLEDDYDEAVSPIDTHRYIVYRATSEALFKHGNDTRAIYFERKAEKELQRIEERYLTQRSALYIKESFKSGPLRVKPYRTLTKTDSGGYR